MWRQSRCGAYEGDSMTEDKSSRRSRLAKEPIRDQQRKLHGFEQPRLQPFPGSLGPAGVDDGGRY